jgi:methionyl aminopeptidase
MWPRRAQEIQIKTPEQFAVMREAGLVVAHTLGAVAAAVRPGVTTAELDALAEREIRAAGATPSFLGYHGYPATICTSVNDEIVHGIPSASRILNEGDLISVDCGAIVRGWHGDAAVTVGVGAISAEHAALLAACQDALWQGLAQARAGARLGDISHAVESSIAAAGPYGVVEEYTGHGIGSPETVLLDDGWTVITADGSWAAHFEHTVAITADGPWVLTAEDGGQARLGDTRQRDPASVPPH